MSWLNGIVESIVNEISADDAYRRFYSSIPRVDYDRILDGDPAPDKFMQFILNCVRDGKDDAEDAVDAVKQYKSLSPEIRQRIQMGVKNGQYDSILDMISQMTYFANGGGIVSKKQFAKKGYIKIKETEDWIVTCTTNYMANNHYFGDSHWCTASDREGEYDGYKMFLRYSKEDGDILLQFRSKKKILPPFRTDEEGTIYPDRSGYPNAEEESENAIRFNYQLIQMSVDINGDMDMICDYLDDRLFIEDVEKIIDHEALSVLKDDNIIKKLFDIQRSQLNDEEEYQNSQEGLIKQKKERKRQRLAAKKEAKRAECDAKQDEANKASLAEWEKFLEGKVYETAEFLEKAIEADNDYREDVDGYNFVRIGAVRDCGPISLLGVWPCSPVCYSVEEVETTHGDVYDYTVERYNQQQVIWDHGMVSVIFNTDTKQVLRSAQSLENDGMASLSKVPLQITEYTQWDTEKGFAHVSNFGGKDYFIKLSDGKFYESSEEVGHCDYCEKIGRDYFVFCNNYEIPVMAYLNCKTGEIVSLEHTPYLESPIFRNRCGFILKNNNSYKIIQRTDDGDLMAPIEISLPNKINGLESEFALTEFVTTKIRFIRLLCEDSEGNKAYNYLSKNNPNELIFGVWGETYSDGREDTEKGIYISIAGRFHNTYKERLAYYLRSKNYTLIARLGEKEEPCDKYAVTEKDRIAKKNFDNWSKNGGHSPEAKAQMDAMWNDHNGDDMSGSKAMQDWDDADLYKDRFASNDVSVQQLGGEKSPQFFKSLMSNLGEPDGKKWRGYVGLKDPEGHAANVTRAFVDAQNDGDVSKLFDKDAPDYVRRNAWYKIGTDGEPLEQSWYDEDEIPANLSDRVVRENKIKNEFNNLQSMMRRMGLIDWL